ncbi:MAG: peptidyl-prolyl cis-trans isomerase [Gemmobacter sp.]
MSQDTASESPKRKRRGAPVLSGVLLAMIVGGLGGYGITNFGSGRVVIGSVGEQEIDANQYARALQNEVAALGQQTGTQIDLQQAIALGVDARVRQSLVTQAALDGEAARIGLSVGDAVLAREIGRMPTFQGPTGTFDTAMYDDALRRNNLTRAEFENGMRGDLSRALLSGAVAGGFAAPDALTDTLLSHAAERRGITVLTLRESSLATPIAEPDDAALRAFYDANIARFTAPEAKRIRFAALLPETMAATMPVDEAELRRIYDERKAEYIQPERRLVERLVFPSEAEANDARARFDAGETFEMLVAARGLKLIDIDMGDVGRDELGAAAEGVFALTEPGVVGPLPSEFGPALYRMNGILSAQETTFEEARADLATEFQMDAARRAIGDKIEAIDDALAGGATIEDLAKEQGMELGQIDFSAASDDKIAGYPAFRTAAEALQEGDFPEAIQLNDGGVAAIQFDQIVPPAPIPFDEVKEDVAEAWRADTLAKALKARAEEIRAEVEAGAHLGKFGILDVSPDISRAGEIEGAPAQVVAEAFTMDVGDVRLVEAPSYVGLVQVDKITPVDATSADGKALRDGIAAQVEQAIAQDAFAMFSTGLANGAGIQFNQSAIDAVHAQLR